MDKRDKKKNPCPQCKASIKFYDARGEIQFPFAQWTNCCGAWEWRKTAGKIAWIRTRL